MALTLGNKTLDSLDDFFHLFGILQIITPQISRLAEIQNPGIYEDLQVLRYVGLGGIK
jgi:hypothetical protein